MPDKTTSTGAIMNVAADGEGLQVPGRIAGGVGVGDVLGDQLLPLADVAETALQHGKQRDLVEVHGRTGGQETPTWFPEGEATRLTRCFAATGYG